jgi:hypothetical protein
VLICYNHSTDGLLKNEGNFFQLFGVILKPAMQQFLRVMLFFFVPVILWGCPYDSPYGIDATAQGNIDESLLGSWAAFVSKPCTEGQYKEEPVEVIFSKNSDLEYNIAITGFIDELKPYHVITNDSIKGTAFISTVSKRQFLNAFIKGRMYIAEIKKDNSALSVFCLAERFTSRYVKSSTELRKAIEIHYKIAASPAFDDYFVLKKLRKVD